MFQFHVNSKDLEEAMRKISIAIPPASQKGDNDGIKLAFYKASKKISKPVGLALAFDGKIQAASALDIQDVSAEEDMIEIHVNGKKMESAAYAFGAINTVLEITIDKDVTIVGAGQKVVLQMCQPIVALKQNEAVLQEVEMSKDDFVNFVNFATSCYGDDKVKRGLHCVGIRFLKETKKLCAVSSNGTRCAYAETGNLTYKPLPASKNKGDETSEQHEQENAPVTVVIEGKQLRNAVRNLSNKKVQIGVVSNKLRIRSGSDAIMILTQELAYPMDALLQFIERMEKKGAWKAPLGKVFQALAIYEVTMEDPLLRMSKKGEAQVLFQGKDELSSATVMCAQNGEVQTVAVDERELKIALSVFDKEKDIIIETAGDKLPVIIRQHEDDPNIITVMPVAE